MNKFIEERDSALLSLDKDRIEAYAKKYGVDLPGNEIVFWAGVHKAILGMGSATNEQRENSIAWLGMNGFNSAK